MCNALWYRHYSLSPFKKVLVNLGSFVALAIDFETVAPGGFGLSEFWGEVRGA